MPRKRRRSFHAVRLSLDAWSNVRQSAESVRSSKVTNHSHQRAFEATCGRLVSKPEVDGFYLERGTKEASQRNRCCCRLPQFSSSRTRPSSLPPSQRQIHFYEHIPMDVFHIRLRSAFVCCLFTDALSAKGETVSRRLPIGLLRVSGP